MPDFDPECLALWCGGTWNRLPQQTLSGLVHDSRSVSPGNLFVAVSGDRFDGHAFCEAAVEKGAAALLVKREVPINLPQLRVPNTRRALIDLATAYRQTLDATVVGITGSVGKTSVKELCANLLQSLEPTARSPGNWNNDLGLPLSLLAIPETSRFAVLEIGMNHPGELVPLCDIFRPQCGIVTNVGPVHIEFFDSEEGIANEKAALIRAIPEEGFVVLDAEGRWFDFLRAQATCEVIAVSLNEQKTDSTVVQGTMDGETLRAFGQEIVLPYPGRHVALNALMSLALANQLGVPQANFKSIVEHFELPGMRWRREEHWGVEVINDAYNANPISMRAALETFAAEPCHGRRWLVLGGMAEMGDAGHRAHQELGRILVTGDWSHCVFVGELARMIHDEAGGDWFADAEEAGQFLKAEIQPGDRVLVKGSRSVQLEGLFESTGD